MTFSNEKASISYTVYDTPDGPIPYVHSFSGDMWAMRGVLREMEDDLTRRGFAFYHVAKDVQSESHEIERIMGRCGLQPKIVIFEKVLNGDRSRYGGNCSGNRRARSGSSGEQRGEQDSEDEPATVGHSRIDAP